VIQITYGGESVEVSDRRRTTRVVVDGATRCMPR